MTRVYGADRFSRTADVKMLAVGARHAPVAENPRKRLPLLRPDQDPERTAIRLLAQVPTGGPGELPIAGEAAGVRHAGQPQVEKLEVLKRAIRIYLLRPNQARADKWKALISANLQVSQWRETRNTSCTTRLGPPLFR